MFSCYLFFYAESDANSFRLSFSPWVIDGILKQSFSTLIGSLMYERNSSHKGLTLLAYMANEPRMKGMAPVKKFI